MKHLLRNTVFRRYAAARVLAGMPTAMRPLVLVLIGHHIWHSFAAAGCLAAASGVAGAVAAPWIGRQLDRAVLPRGLAVHMWGGCGAFVGLAVGSLSGNGTVVVAAGLCTSLSASGLGAGMRGLLPALFPGDLEDAFTADAVLIELMWILGPALAGATALASPAAAALAAAACPAAGAVVARRLPPRPGRDSASVLPTNARSVFGYPAFWVALMLDIGLGGHVGALDTALPSAMAQIGSAPADAGVVLGLIAIASAAGGALSLHVRVRSALGRLAAPSRGAVLLLVFGAVLLPAAEMHALLALTLDLIVAGTLLAVINGAASAACSNALPHRHSEAFAVMGAAAALSASAGSATAGLLAGGSSPAQGLLVAACIPMAAGLVAAILCRVTSQPSARKRRTRILSR